MNVMALARNSVIVRNICGHVPKSALNVRQSSAEGISTMAIGAASRLVSRKY